MKYYAAPYGELPGKYDLSKLQAFENPYEALEYANKNWDSVFDNQIPRLLVVITDDYISNTEGMAFFQFTDADVCANFVAGREEIIWSCTDIHKQRWNGNANMM